MKQLNILDIMRNLRRVPQSSAQAAETLRTLQVVGDCIRPQFTPRPLSKRRARLVKMYWAYKRQGL